MVSKNEHPQKVLKFTVLIFCFICLIILRQLFGQFGISLGYLYFVLILLSGYWFGMTGGLITAVITFLIFIVELQVLKLFPFRDLVIKGVYLRFFAYLLGGLGTGYFTKIMKKMKSRLKSLQFYDSQTGCLNFVHIIYSLGKEIENSKSKNKEFALVLIDIDNFKEINKTYGYLAGNDILKKFVNVVKSNLRNIDLIGRYGGDKFLIIFPGATTQQVSTVIKSIKSKIEQKKIVTQYIQGREGILVNFNTGIVSFPQQGKNPEDLLRSVVDALFLSK